MARKLLLASLLFFMGIIDLMIGAVGALTQSITGLFLIPAAFLLYLFRKVHKTIPEDED
ncbi:MAG: hypothetical protein IJ220_03175 [Clostridia bacterium]|nr:hypothetical protein [Clostridia bacterium]